MNSVVFVLRFSISRYLLGDDLSLAIRRQKNLQKFGQFGPGFDYGDDNDNLVFIDDHDSQRHGNVLSYRCVHCNR